jgi:2-desacetyl-2-hydroxyethyl bacteriochlorophyllide A dehydrogenase
VRAAVFTTPGTIELGNVADPDWAPDEVVVRVSTCGICGTDRSIFRGEAPSARPVVLGHEFSGEVVEIGAQVAGLRIGDRVTVDPNVVDGTCFYCRRGETHLCSGLSPLGISRPGGFAEFAAVPAKNAYRLPDSVSVEAGSLVEPLACCVHGIDQAAIRLGDIVVVLGAGPIGVLLIQLARLRGARTIVAVEPEPARHRHAAGAGADQVVRPEDASAALAELGETGAADVVIEASGNAAAAEWTFALVRRGGTVLLFGVYPEHEQISVTPFRVNEDELRIVGSLNNPNTHQRAIDLLASGRVNAGGLITHRLELAQLSDALVRENFPGAGKITVHPGTSTETPTHSARC